MPLRIGAALILCAVSVYGQYLCSYISSWLLDFLAAHTTVTWMGDTVDAPMLLYHDEIYVSTDGTVPSNSSEGVLVCRSQSGLVWWHHPGLTIVPTYSNKIVPTIYQIKTSESVSTLLRSVDISENSPALNGLWVCQLSSSEVSTVGLYMRGMGK